MSNIKETLYTLVNYYNSTRQVGHTTTMIEGLKDKDCIILCHNMQMGDRLKKQYGLKRITCVTPHNINNLRGRLQPLAIDNAALYTILQDCLSEIQHLEEANKYILDIKKIVNKNEYNKL